MNLGPYRELAPRPRAQGPSLRARIQDLARCALGALNEDPALYCFIGCVALVEALGGVTGLIALTRYLRR